MSDQRYKTYREDGRDNERRSHDKIHKIRCTRDSGMMRATKIRRRKIDCDRSKEGIEKKIHHESIDDIDR